MYGEKLFPRLKKGILERDQHFFQRSFIAGGVGECWYAENVSFCLNNCEICDKSTDKFVRLREVYY